MKVLYYDCFSGISGDMNLGAMLDLGIDPMYLIKELKKLDIEEEYEINIREEKRKGITGKRVEMLLTEEIKNTSSHNHNHHTHSHSSDHCHENITDRKVNTKQKHNKARTLSDIEMIINQSTISHNAKTLSLRMFHRLAEAEGSVHGLDKDKVHFHEVGAVDSILDIVGAAICFDYLQVDRILSSPIELGGGFVRCDHGILPVPAPAVIALLQGIPVTTGRVKFETTTPTGAVILAENVQEFTDELQLRINKVGYGVGKRDTEIPNVLRVYLGEISSNVTHATTQVVMETNIDDMNPEIYEHIEDKLFKRGALDVYKTPIIMKKGRPAIKLSVLASEERICALKEIIFKETSVIGIRSYPVQKIMLERESKRVKTKYGDVMVKFSYLNGKLLKYKAEYEDCKRIAVENEIPLIKIYRDIDVEIAKLLNA